MGKLVTIENIEKRSSVVILAAGPSINSGTDFLKQFIHKHNSVVLGCNHNFSICADYAVVMGTGQFKKNKDLIKANKLIISSNIEKKFSKYLNENKRIFYTMCEKKDVKKEYWKEKSISFTKGCFKHCLINTGFSCLLASSFFNPKHIIIAGLDGLDSDKNGLHYSKKFDGTRKYFKQKGHETKSMTNEKKKFLSIVVDFIFKKGIVVGVLDESPFWGCRKYVETKIVNASSIF